MALGIIGLFIIGFTILIQIADSKIDEEREELRTKELSNLHYHTIARQNQLNTLYYGLAASKCILLDINESEIIFKFNNQRDNYRNHSNIANMYADEINDLRSYNSPWIFAKRVFVVFQLSLIVISVFGYFYILKEIHKRSI